MDFLIPNNILDKLICDCCFKTLSVTPVKVYSNSQTKCGRCSLKDDSSDSDGVLSLYNTIASRSIFRCINRFDGCRALLKSSEVRAHESVCHTSYSTCPICNEINPTYLIISHFNRNHNEAHLEDPHFILEGLQDIPKYFLYAVEEDLFIINILGTANTISTSDICITCSHLDERNTSNTFKFKFAIHYGDNLIEEEINCGLPAQKILCLPTKKCTLVIFTIRKEKADDVILKLPKECQMYETKLDSVNRFNRRQGLTSYFQERDIFLNESFLSLFADTLILNGSTFTYTVSGIKKCVTLQCFMCSIVKYCYNINSLDKLYFANINGKYHLMCYPCVYLRNWNVEILLSNSDFNYISFFCAWKCGTLCNVNQLYEHERECNAQSAQKCPVETCGFFGNFLEVEKHFKEEHPQLLPLQFGNDLNGLYPLKLIIKQSPIKVYFVASNVYICAEFVWKQPFWNVSLSCDLPDASPRAVLYGNESNNPKYLGFVKISGYFRHMDSFQIKCYLANPNKEMFENDIVSNRCFSDSD